MQSSTGLYRFLASRIAAGERVALVTVTDVTGSSVRNPGAQMAISECGAYAGTLSGGCIERAVIAEAQAAIAARAAPDRLWRRLPDHRYTPAVWRARRSAVFAAGRFRCGR